jgi:hypothetical protein
MKQYEQIIRVMENNSGYATLGYLYQNVDMKDWKTKTPFVSIRKTLITEEFSKLIKYDRKIKKQIAKIQDSINKGQR